MSDDDSYLLAEALERGAIVRVRGDQYHIFIPYDPYGGFCNADLAKEIVHSDCVREALAEIGDDQGRRDWWLVSFAWHRELQNEWEEVEGCEAEAWDRWRREDDGGLTDLRLFLGNGHSNGVAPRFNSEGGLGAPAWVKRWESAWLAHVRQPKNAEQGYNRRYFARQRIIEREFFEMFRARDPVVIPRCDWIMPELIGDRFAESHYFVQVRSRP